MLPTREQIVRLPGTAPSASPSPPKPLQPSLEGTP
ncbi:hypothetical protein EDD91_2690 [Streptomyces sp. KS 21]|nr:hypothetical protein EDD91_2690 [Streptomyces sp. KS 21]